MKKNLIASTLLFAITILICFIGVEIAFRFYLHSQIRRQAENKDFKYDSKPTISFYHSPPWVFDKDQGFHFNSEKPWLWGMIKDGAFASYEKDAIANKYGNYGEAIGDYETADIKIMLLGSSHTLVKLDKDYTTNLLQENLSKKLGKRVHILNYSRDSTGVLTMFDIARAKIDEMKPDLILFTFNTSALVFPRHWRFVLPTPEHQGFYRFYQSIIPEVTTDPRLTILHPYVISDWVTKEWYEEMMKAEIQGDQKRLREDPLIKKMIEEYNGNRRAINGHLPIAISFLTPRASFVLNMLFHKDPYYKMQKFEKQTICAPISIKDYSEDARFAEAITYIKSKNIPFSLIHLPSYPEWNEKKDYAFESWGVLSEQGNALVKSLEKLCGQNIALLTNYYPQEKLKEPVKLVGGEKDYHPNREGIQTMTLALEKFLMENFFNKTNAKK